MIQKTFSVKRIINAFRYSWDGLKAAFISEAAFRLEILAAIILIPTALYMNVSTTGRVLLIGSVFLVMIVELINSAIEATIERISSDIHPLSKQAKDIGSAAVFMALVMAGMTWGLIVF